MTNSSFIRTGSVLMISLVFILPFFSSCYTSKPYTYLQGSFDTASLSHIPISDPLIRRGDVLSIVVFSDNPEATVIFNQGMGGGASASGLGGGAGGGSTGGSGSGSGYTVDEKGNIEMQGVGLLHVEGITRSSLRDSLDSRLKDKYLKNPYYTIRFVNYRVTMLGEINRPGEVNIPGTQVNLLQALGMAGDLTFYGRRDNILVIRDSLGKRQFGRMDLTKPEVMNSPYFYLQQGDIVYVEQTKKKIAANDQTLFRNITIATSVISIFAILYTIFR